MGSEQSGHKGEGYKRPKSEEELIEEIFAVMKKIDDAHEPGSGMSFDDEMAQLKQYPPELVQQCQKLRRSAMYELSRPQWIGGRQEVA